VQSERKKKQSNIQNTDGHFTQPPQFRSPVIFRIGNSSEERKFILFILGGNVKHN